MKHMAHTHATVLLFSRAVGQSVKLYHWLHTAGTLRCPAMPRPKGTCTCWLLNYSLEQGGAAAGQQLIVPVATPWPPHHPMATDAAFGAPLRGRMNRAVNPYSTCRPVPA